MHCQYSTGIRAFCSIADHVPETRVDKAAAGEGAVTAVRMN